MTTSAASAETPQGTELSDGPGHAVAADLEPLVGAGLVSVDSGGLITAWTAQAERTFGWRRGEVIGHPLVATVAAPSQRTGHERELERVLAGEASASERRFQIHVRHRDGDEFTADVALVPVPLGRGYEFSAFLDDVGSREWTAEELARLHARHAQVLDAALFAFRAEARPGDDAEGRRAAGALVLFRRVDGGRSTVDGERPQEERPQATGHGAQEERRQATGHGAPEERPQAIGHRPQAPEPEPSVALEAPEPEPTPEPAATAGGPWPVARGLEPPPAPISSEQLRDTLEAGRFALSCAPVLDLRTNEVGHFELLLRMTDEHGRLVLPQGFVGVAERAGLMRAIDSWLVRRAISLLAEQQEKGRYVRLELSLSAHSLDDPELASSVEQELAATGADPSRLVLGVSEQVASAAPDVTAALATRLRAIGCRFALREFGSSFTAMRHLKQLPLDYVKLDGGLISTFADSRTDQLVLKAVVDIADGIGAETVAELVSDERTLILLRQAGVSYAQGYHVGPPRRVSEAWSAPPA